MWASLDPEQTKPLHGLCKILKEKSLVGSIAQYKWPGTGVRHEERIRCEEAKAPLQILVISVVKPGRCDWIIEGGEGGVLQVVGAGSLKGFGKADVKARVDGTPSLILIVVNAGSKFPGRWKGREGGGELEIDGVEMMKDNEKQNY